MASEKTQIAMTVQFLKEGGIKPLLIGWLDGEEYPIDKILARENKPSKTGVILVERFTVSIDGQIRYVYYDKEKEVWFVERKV